MRKFILVFFLLLFADSACAAEVDPRKIVEDAVDYWRDVTSYTTSQMTVHRPDWQREMAMLVWTKGRTHSLVRFTAPAKDAGNASLSVDEDTWTYSPKVNRVIKIPPSMKGQSWMGSDFSYRDLSKADDIVDHYTHKLLSEDTHEGKKVYVIEMIPLDDAPVVWGKEILKIRSDKIILEHEFYDQDLKLIKRLTAREVKEIGGKLYATALRMEKVEEKGEWTQIVHTKAEFGNPIPDGTFTQSNLRNRRQRR